MGLYLAAQFLRAPLTTPASNPPGTRGIGNHNPGRRKFYLLQPLPAEPETAALRAEVEEPGRFDPGSFSYFFPHMPCALSSQTPHPSFQPKWAKTCSFRCSSSPPPNPLTLGFGGGSFVSRHRPKSASNPLLVRYPT